MTRKTRPLTVRNTARYRPPPLVAQSQAEWLPMVLSAVGNDHNSSGSSSRAYSPTTGRGQGTSRARVGSARGYSRGTVHLRASRSSYCDHYLLDLTRWVRSQVRGPPFPFLPPLGHAPRTPAQHAAAGPTEWAEPCEVQITIFHMGTKKGTGGGQETGGWWGARAPCVRPRGDAIVALLPSHD